MKKSIGELIDELGITNVKIFHLVGKAQRDKRTREDTKKLQDLNRVRSELVKAINDYFDERKDIKEGAEKSINELIDELEIVNIKIFHLIEKVYDDKHTRDDARKIQELNKFRSKLVNAINEYLGDKKKDIKV